MESRRWDRNSRWRRYVDIHPGLLHPRRRWWLLLLHIYQTSWHILHARKTHRMHSVSNRKDKLVEKLHNLSTNPGVNCNPCIWCAMPGIWGGRCIVMPGGIPGSPGMKPCGIIPGMGGRIFIWIRVFANGPKGVDTPGAIPGPPGIAAACGGAALSSFSSSSSSSLSPPRKEKSIYFQQHNIPSSN